VDVALLGGRAIKEEITAKITIDYRGWAYLALFELAYLRFKGVR
jgi:hypothetical protein